ncbi:MAG: acyltransferase [Bacteroidaceae bacterium]|nr:acyltransferase [Bacteroidaceae bacterium]
MRLRNTNVELLRFILMVMIVFWHFMRHGFPMYFSGDDTGNYQFSFLEYSVLAFLCCHVNCFVFISGYYGISINRKKIISFLTMTTFYGVFTYGLKVVLDNQFTIGEVVKSILPISSEGWWFFSYYFVLMLLSPFLNEGIERLSKRKIQYILFVLFIFSVSGFGFVLGKWNQAFLFIFMYILGAYFRKYPIRFVTNNPLLIYAGSVLLIICGIGLYEMFPVCFKAISLIMYGNPLCITAAVGLFFCFNRMNVGVNVTLNTLASGVFAAYLMTDWFLRYYFNYYPVKITGGNLFLLVAFAIVLVAAISAFEQLRKHLMQPLDNMLYERLKNI